MQNQKNIYGGKFCFDASTRKIRKYLCEDLRIPARTSVSEKSSVFKESINILRTSERSSKSVDGRE